MSLNNIPTAKLGSVYAYQNIQHTATCLTGYAIQLYAELYWQIDMYYMGAMGCGARSLVILL